MAIIVQKFGGTSVGSTERIKTVAELVKREVNRGNKVAVVVSAMSGVTDSLIKYANEVSGLADNNELEEYDSVIATGEQVTSGLLALALKKDGLPARSYLGWQVPVLTDDTHSKARIMEIGSAKILASLNKGEVVVIPGFQGITEGGRVTTLGRGGSDTSAVAVAAAIKADRCDIYTDVDGVYTTDPRIVSKARKLAKVAYEEMLEMASLGAKVLQTRSVEMAMKHKVRVQVLSSFPDTGGNVIEGSLLPGTLLVEEEEVMERRLVTGIAYSRGDARVTLTKVANVPGVAAKIFGPLAEAEINVDMIVQNVSESGLETDLTFTVTKTDLDRAVKVLEDSKSKGVVKFEKLTADSNVAKISVIGVGMRSHAGIAQKMFSALAEKNINILVISTSEIKISVLIDEAYTELAVRILHAAYGLETK